MSYLRFNKDNSALSCGCGAICITLSAWNVMTEHKRQDYEKAAKNCRTCIQEQNYELCRHRESKNS